MGTIPLTQEMLDEMLSIDIGDIEIIEDDSPEGKQKAKEFFEELDKNPKYIEAAENTKKIVEKLKADGKI